LEEDQATGKRAFRFMPGPVFANIVLADEVNRTPPKTQAALLQAMQEHQVTAGGRTHPLPAPFFVLATQNPIEQEGTYPLPEAQLDRFMFELRVNYPSPEEERRIVAATTADEPVEIRPVLTAEDVLALQHLVRRIAVTEALVGAAVGLVRGGRPGGGGGGGRSSGIEETDAGAQLASRRALTEAGPVGPGLQGDLARSEPPLGCL